MDGNNRSTSIPMRTGIPRPSTAGESSGIPRPASRAGAASALPTSARGRFGAPPVSHVPNTAASGPLGAYNRPASRISSIGSLPGTQSHDVAADAPVAATPAASRIRYSGVGAAGGVARGGVPQSAAPEWRAYDGIAGRISVLSSSTAGTSNGIGLMGAPLSQPGSAKRNISAADISDESLNASAQKRAARRLSADGTSLLLLADLHPASTPRPESPAYELSILRANHEQELVAESRKYKQLEEDYESKCKEIDRYTKMQAELLDEWDRAQEAKKKKENEWTKTKATLEEELYRLRTTNSSLTNQLSEVQSSTSGAEQELRTKNTSLEAQLGHAKAEAEAAKAEAARLKDEVGAVRAEIDDLENAYEDEKRLRIKERDESRLGGEEGKKISEELGRQTSYIRKLEAENAHLVAETGRFTQHASNVELLKEEKRTLEAKLRVLDELRMKLADAESTIQEYEEHKQEWTQLLHNGLVRESEATLANPDGTIPTVEAPTKFDSDTLPAYISALRSNIFALTARSRGLETSLEKLRARNLQLEEDSCDTESQQRKVNTEFAQLRNSLTRSQKTEERLSDEISRLKAILQSYETEERNHKASYDEANSKRIKMLEAEKQLLKQTISELQEEVDSVRRELVNIKPKVDIDALNAQLETYAAQVHSLERQLAESQASFSAIQKELDGVVQENETLYNRVGRGEFNQQHTKCLVLDNNPLQRDLDLRKATLEALKKENEVLLNRLEEVNAVVGSAGQGGGEGLVPQQVVDNLKGEIDELNEKVHLSQKAQLRLKQVYSMKAHEFRDVVQSLFGYKIKFMENGKVKLTSMFGRSTSLTFKSSEGNVGEMKLLADEMLSNIQGLREYWLDSRGLRQSVPCFLAALNLELYENCTMAIRRAAVGEEEDEE